MSNENSSHIITSTDDVYSASLIIDPLGGAQYIACLHNFNTEEPVDGYIATDIKEMIKFLNCVLENLQEYNRCINTPTLFDTIAARHSPVEMV